MLTIDLATARRCMPGKNEACEEALAGEFARFVRLLGASMLDSQAVREPLLRGRIEGNWAAKMSGPPG